METECAETVSDETMLGLCRLMRVLFAPHRMDLFENIRFEDTCAAFALSTDECCFLIDRIRHSTLRDYHILTQAVGKLAVKEPKARIFGILLVGAAQEITPEFLRFGEKHRIALLKPAKVAGFIKKKLEIKT